MYITQHTKYKRDSFKRKSSSEMEMKENEEEGMMRNQVPERFADFCEKWMLERDSFLKQLFSIAQRDNHNHQPTVLLCDLDDSSSDHDQFYRDLISKLMNQINEYYSTKWAGDHEDILGFLFPPWVTPFEKAHHWVTDWKPSMLFRLIRTLNRPQVLPNTVVGGSLINLTDYQLKRIEELRLRIVLEEEKVDRGMERQQMSLVDRKMVELAGLASHRRVRNVGEINNVVVEDHQVDELVEVAINGLVGEMEKLVMTADGVRLMTLKGVLEVFTPLQSVDFMAAFLMLQFQLRREGKKRLSSTSAN